MTPYLSGTTLYFATLNCLSLLFSPYHLIYPINRQSLNFSSVYYLIDNLNYIYYIILDFCVHIYFSLCTDQNQIRNYTSEQHTENIAL
jgi:hypothetical protein